jgi:RIO-like serine/threonine protein kinase
MRALGRDELPEIIEVENRNYRREKIVKHDFFAATGFYAANDATRAVLKMGRTTTFFGIPFKWIGRRLCQRELNCYRRLADVPNVPDVLGVVAETGFLHAYVPGRPLARKDPVPDDFFAQLQSLLAELHGRNIAYVDTNKPENILLGDDGRPYLIDFQISVALDADSRNPIKRWWLHRLQRADIYHILKHKRRMRKDQLTEEEAKIVAHHGPLIHLHRIVTKPYFFVRRRLFKWLRRTGLILPEGSK